MARLTSVCVRRSFDYWKYEVCFEGEIKQIHGATQMSLGRFVGMDGPVQVYEDGSECESKAAGGVVRRRTRVELVCDRQLRIRSVDETSTCAYRLVVGTPVVCGLREFGVAPPDGDDASASSSGESPRELWMVEMVEMDDARVACTARALTSDVRARPDRPSLTVLRFASFHLEVSGAGLAPALDDDVGVGVGAGAGAAADSNGLRLAHDLHVCRAPDRVRLSSSEREYSLRVDAASARAAPHAVSLLSGDAFRGELEFLYLQLRTA